MKIKQRKRTVVIKKLRSAYISEQKTKSVYFKLRPSLRYATAEHCSSIFLFLGSEGGGHVTVPPLYTLVIGTLFYFNVSISAKSFSTVFFTKNNIFQQCLAR